MKIITMMKIDTMKIEKEYDENRHNESTLGEIRKK